MFEFLRAVEIDAEAGSAKGEAVIDADLALLRDHFHDRTVLPGSWLVELGAQVAGLLCEEAFQLEGGERRFAILGMIRNATFPRPTFLPARLEIAAEILRKEEGFCLSRVTVLVEGEAHMRAELVMTLNESRGDFGPAIEARAERLQRILRGSDG